MEDKKVTLRDIAEKVGLSRNAVSLALRGSSSIPRQRRDEIQRVAAKLGYVPNPKVAEAMTQIALSKRRKISEGLGLIYLVNKESLRQWEAAQLIIDGFVERAETFGYRVESFQWEPGEGRKLRRILKARGIRGVALTGAWQPELGGHLRMLCEEFSAISMPPRVHSPAISAVQVDVYQTARNAMLKLQKYGYKRPGAMLSPNFDRNVELRNWAGFASVLRDNADLNNLPIYDAEPLDAESLRRWLDEHRPDALVIRRSGVTRLFEEIGIKPGEDLGLLYIGRLPSHTHRAGMDNQNWAVGANGADLLIGQLRRGEIGPPSVQKIVMVESVFRDGPTLPDRRAGHEKAAPGGPNAATINSTS